MIASSPYYQEVFKILAPHYGLVDILSFGAANLFRKTAIKNAGIKPQTTIVDLMCGTGNNAAFLVKESRSITYVGVDLCTSMLERAIYNYSRCKNMSFINANVLGRLPLHSKANHILCTYGLKCLPREHYLFFVNSLDTILTHGGTFSILEFQPPKNVLFRTVMKIYLNTVYAFFTFLLIGSSAPARALVGNLSIPLHTDLLRELLVKKGFEVETEYRWNDAVVFIFGRKRDTRR